MFVLSSLLSLSLSFSFSSALHSPLRSALRPHTVASSAASAGRNGRRESGAVAGEEGRCLSLTTKCDWMNWMVRADFPTPPPPTTTSLYSLIPALFIARGLALFAEEEEGGRKRGRDGEERERGTSWLETRERMRVCVRVCVCVCMSVYQCRGKEEASGSAQCAEGN